MIKNLQGMPAQIYFAVEKFGYLKQVIVFDRFSSVLTVL